MDDYAWSDGAHRVERLAAGVALKRLDVDSFVKTRVNDPGGSLDWIADESVAPAFPRRGFFAVIIAFDILVKGRTVAAEQGIIVGRKNQVQRLRVTGYAAVNPRSKAIVPARMLFPGRPILLQQLDVVRGKTRRDVYFAIGNASIDLQFGKWAAVDENEERPAARSMLNESSARRPCSFNWNKAPKVPSTAR
jgi:hypothetical protein